MRGPYFAQALKRYLIRRKFFITKLGYMGIGPLALQEGDMVCMIPGCKVPLLIRSEADYRRLVGMCFVWGLMDGEGLEGKNVDKEREIFRLM